MAAVFSHDAWRCFWRVIQNDLDHRWGLDFALRRCIELAHEKIGAVEAQWIVHQCVRSLGNQGQAENGKAPWEGVRERCKKEWTIFQECMSNAEKAYFLAMGGGSSKVNGPKIAHKRMSCKILLCIYRYFTHGKGKQ